MLAVKDAYTYSIHFSTIFYRYRHIVYSLLRTQMQCRVILVLYSIIKKGLQIVVPNLSLW